MVALQLDYRSHRGTVVLVRVEPLNRTIRFSASQQHLKVIKHLYKQVQLDV